MSEPAHAVKSKVWTPSELRALPAAQRDAVLAAAAAAAEHFYRTDPELTAFDDIELQSLRMNEEP